MQDFPQINSICDLSQTFCYVHTLWRRTKVPHTLQSRTGAKEIKKKKVESSHRHCHVSCAHRGLSAGPAAKWAGKVGERSCVQSVSHRNRYKHRLEWGKTSRDRHWGYYNFLLLLPVRFHLGFIYLITAGTGLDSCCFRHCACLYELLFSSIIWAASAGCVLGSGGRQELQCSHRRDRPARTIELFQHSINVMALTGCRNSLIGG